MRLTAYMCKKKLGTKVRQLPFSDQGEVTDYDTEAQLITTKIMRTQLPDGCKPPIHNLYKADLKPDDFGSIWTICLPECWYYDNPAMNMIRWTRGIQVQEETEIMPFPELEYYNPDHCHWIESQLLAFGPTRISDSHGEVLAFTNPPHGGEIPDSREDAFSGGVWTYYQIVQNVIVPGMEVRVRHLFGNTETTVRIEADNFYFCSCCLTGGRISSVVGDGEYRVQVEGLSQIAWSSDHVSYAVGDWVFLMPVPPDANCQDPDRTEPCKAACGDPTEDEADSKTFVILPLKIGQDGA